LTLGNDFGRCPRRPDADLYDAIPIAKIDENDSSEITAPVDPASQTYALSNVVLPQRTAAVGS
jgi:hypothetical protein